MSAVDPSSSAITSAASRMTTDTLSPEQFEADQPRADGHADILVVRLIAAAGDQAGDVRAMAVCVRWRRGHSAPVSVCLTSDTKLSRQRIQLSGGGADCLVVMKWTDWMAAGEWRTLDVVPMVPTVAREVLEFSTDPDVSAQRIANVVNRDPVLATRVLQLANSAFSGSAVEVTSIRDAVVRLGTQSVRNVVTAVCVASLLANRGVYGTRGRDLIDHGIGTTYLAWFLAEAMGESRDEAFVCGLLHDIGKLLIQQLAQHPPRGITKPEPAELAVTMTEQHAAFGGDLLRWWKLPAALSDAVTFHHDPARAHAHSTGAVVAYAANRLAHRHGFGCPPQDFDPLTDPVFAEIQVEAAALQRIDKQAQGIYDMARQLKV